MATMRAKAGFWDTLLRPAWRYLTPNVQYLNTVGEAVEELFGDTYTPYEMWRTQPHLRTVLTFLARNTAHVGMHLYERRGDDDRRRDTTSVAAQLLRSPNSRMTMYDLLFALTIDRKLYDRAYWWVRPADRPSGYEIVRLPPAWVSPIAKNRFEVKEYDVVNDKGDVVKVPVGEVVDFTGYHPTSPLAGSPTLTTLKDILLEQLEAALYRKQVWKRGGRVSAVLTRPLGAKWSDGARTSFRTDWYAKWTGNGEMAGGTPILEDGMDIKRIDFSAQDQQFVEASKLAMSTIASAFHVQPSMVGVLDNANFSVVKEFRQMLYTETLGPDFEEVAQRLDGFLLPMLRMDPARYYYEFNIQRKLSGSFEEQAALLSTSVGGPWMLRDEARSRMNLPKIEGGDQLIVPLNVLVGGQASPRDSGTQNEEPKTWPQYRPKAALPKAAGDGPVEEVRDELVGYADKYTEIVSGFFRRQRAAANSKLKAGRKDWWDAERWDAELGHDLTAWATMTGTETARATLAGYGFDEDAFDPELALGWYTAQSHGAAKAINASTKKRIDEALAVEDEADRKARLDNVFSQERAGWLAVSAVTIVAGFSRHEAGVQSGAGTKTWITGANPRPEHASMDGETVKTSENFSNGLAWPGDGAGDVEDVAGCNCSLDLSWG